MKKLLLIAATIMMALMNVQAKDIPAGMRMEIIEADEEDKNQYSIFQYKDNDGTVGYYMSVGRYTELLGLIRDDLASTFGQYDEVCLYMGSTRDEVVTSLDKMLEQMGKANGTTIEYDCRLATWGQRLGEKAKTTCIVTKRFLQSKRLCFYFNSGGNRTTYADLTKSGIKSMRLSVKLDIRLHPDRD